MASGSESVLFNGVTPYPEAYMQYKLHSVSLKKLEDMKLMLGKGGQGWVPEELGEDGVNVIKTDSIHVFGFQRSNTDVIHICRRHLLSLQTITKENAKTSRVKMLTCVQIHFRAV